MFRNISANFSDFLQHVAELSLKLIEIGYFSQMFPSNFVGMAGNSR